MYNFGIDLYLNLKVGVNPMATYFNRLVLFFLEPQYYMPPTTYYQTSAFII